MAAWSTLKYLHGLLPYLFEANNRRPLHLLGDRPLPFEAGQTSAILEHPAATVLIQSTVLLQPDVGPSLPSGNDGTPLRMNRRIGKHLHLDGRAISFTAHAAWISECRRSAPQLRWSAVRKRQMLLVRTIRRRLLDICTRSDIAHFRLGGVSSNDTVPISSRCRFPHNNLSISSFGL